MKSWLKIFSGLILVQATLLVLQGCSVYPSLTHGYVPDQKIEEKPIAKKILIMKPLDMRGHAGSTPIYWAYVPFVPYVRIIEEPEHFVYVANGYNYDYEEDFAKLVSEDLQASGIASSVVINPDSTEISKSAVGTSPPDYIIKISLDRLEWQTKYSMFGLSIVGFIPQIIGFPNTYGFSYLTFVAEIFDAKNNSLSLRTFVASESQNGWIFYDSGYLRALTKAYEDVSPDFREYVASTIKETSEREIKR